LPRARLGAERVPSLDRYRARELLDPRLERIRDSREKPPALARDHARPSGKCLSRGVHRTRDILDAAARDLGDRRRCAGSSTSSTSPDALSTHFRRST
jgi:hypothetical protein